VRRPADYPARIGLDLVALVGGIGVLKVDRGDQIAGGLGGRVDRAGQLLRGVPEEQSAEQDLPLTLDPQFPELLRGPVTSVPFHGVLSTLGTRW
jgi:hypothetical protein